MIAHRQRTPARPLWLVVLLMLTLLFSATAGAGQAQAGCAKANAAASKLKKKQVRKAIRCVVNKQRGPNASPDPRLREAAQGHTSRMRRHNCFSHQCSGEPSLYERIKRTGYFRGARSYAFGEVIAQNRATASPRDIVRQFMGSSSHRATLLDRQFKHLGVGVSVRRGTGLYTIVVGRRSG